MASFKGYDALKRAVATWLARSDLERDIPDFIWLAEVDLQRTIKFRLQDKIEKGSTITNQEYIELPEDYAEGGFLDWTNDVTLPAINVTSYDVTSQIRKGPPLSRSSGGDTRVGTIHGNRLYIAKATGSNVTYDFFYKSGVQHLGDTVDTNLLLDQYPDCLLFGALMVSAPFLGADDRIPTWEKFYTNAKEETRMQEWRSRSSHGVLRMRSDVWPLR